LGWCGTLGGVLVHVWVRDVFVDLKIWIHNVDHGNLEQCIRVV
jgi:hypothetical protein